MHKRLQEERQSNKNEVKELIMQTQSQYLRQKNAQAGPHLAKALEAHKESLKAIKNANKIEPGDSKWDDHGSNLEGFTDRYAKKSARDFFASFFYRVNPGHKESALPKPPDNTNHVSKKDDQQIKSNNQKNPFSYGNLYPNCSDSRSPFEDYESDSSCSNSS